MKFFIRCTGHDFYGEGSYGGREKFVPRNAAPQAPCGFTKTSHLSFTCVAVPLAQHQDAQKTKEIV